jgi:Zn-finger nucleic acid-binding protein
MTEETLVQHLGQPVVIDLCLACHGFWFDAKESLRLSPASTLRLFRLIGEHPAPTEHPAGVVRCPRCRVRLTRTHDQQRATRFEYLSCPNGHGRFTTFFNFLREKDFIRPLPAAQLDELRRNLEAVNCSNCGAAINLGRETACSHCGSPLSVLDLKQAATLVEELQRADRKSQDVDPALPMRLAAARRETEAAFAALERNPEWFQSVASTGLVGASLTSVARWLKDRL